MQEGDAGDSVAADWDEEFGSSMLDGTASMELRGILEFHSIFDFPLKILF